MIIHIDEIIHAGIRILRTNESAIVENTRLEPFAAIVSDERLGFVEELLSLAVIVLTDVFALVLNNNRVEFAEKPVVFG